MSVTITIQTYNRAEELRRTLVSLSQIDTDGVPCYEVLVVDNNSQDHTPEVVDGLLPLFAGALRYVRETRQGLSHARNRAIAEARYEIVAFLDDDVNVDRGWLRALVSAYQRGDYAAVGGRAYLVYPGPRPSWLNDENEGLLTKVDYGPVSRAALPEELYGVNLSFKRVWLRLTGGFRVDLGRIGKCLLSSEELEVLERVAQNGGKLLFEPAASVGHRVPIERLNRRWFWSRCYWGQRGAARIIPASAVSSYQLLRATWHVGLMGSRVFRSFLRHGPRSAECFSQTLQLASRLGFWVGLLQRFGKRLLCCKSLPGQHRRKYSDELSGKGRAAEAA
jgi:glycosyltransferase involved in cell wall biosynthesis